MKTTTLLGVVTLTFTIAIHGQAQSFLTNGLVAYYPFNANANDLSPNANNGTPNNALLTADKLNVPSSAYAFNGVNAYVAAPNQAYLTFPGGGDFSMSVWAAFNSLPTTFPNGVVYFLGMDNGSGANPKWMFAYGELALPQAPGYGGRHFVHFLTGGSTPSTGYWLACKEYTPLVGAWHHYLITKAGNTYTLYIDGVAASGTTNYLWNGVSQQAGVVGPSGVSSGITAPLTIGFSGPDSGYFNGKLDDVRIYNRALSTTEVQQLHAIESGPRVALIKAVKPSFYNLSLTTNYQMQVSADMNTWTNHGSPFTATNTSMVYPQYWDVQNWNSLYFRLQVAP